uniref:Uncharacterized protein n=1 Tax=Schizaphis graminum TaxID=13262 RepID=A0A2S2NGD0_SCHGA
MSATIAHVYTIGTYYVKEKDYTYDDKVAVVHRANYVKPLILLLLSSSSLSSQFTRMVLRLRIIHRALGFNWIGYEFGRVRGPVEIICYPTRQRRRSRAMTVARLRWTSVARDRRNFPLYSSTS